MTAVLADSSAALKTSPGTSIADRVKAQLQRDYPPGALSWVDDLAWSGPTRVPLTQIDKTSGDTEWSAAAADKLKLQRFQKRIAAGWRKPVVLVRSPGSPRMFAVDGHTRILSCEALGQPVTAWVGTAKTATGPWRKVHSRQLANDDDAIELVGPEGYIHGWIKVGEGKPSADALRSMSPSEKNAYVKTGNLPDRLKGTGDRLPAKHAAVAAVKQDSVPAPRTKAELVHHLTEHHSGLPAGGRHIGPKTPTAAQLKANHDNQHAVRSGLDHEHGPAIAEQRRLTGMWTRAFRYSNKTQGTLRDAQFTNELHRLLSTNKPPSKYTPGARDARDFLGMVDRGATVQKTPLYRGLQMPAGDVARVFSAGKTVDLPVSSWGKSEGTGKAFGQGGVILQAAPGARGLDLSPIESGGGAELEYRLQLQEVVTGGRFTVESVTVRNGTTYVNLGRQGGFRAH